MKSSLESRRRHLLRALDRINRRIVWTQKSLARIESRIAAVPQQGPRAA